ncbi:MAG: hypothetical protein QW390_01975 [Candidatus Bathyarchaeia archaeon]
MSVSPSGVVYWFRFLLAIATGVLSFRLGLDGTEGLWLMIITYILSYLAVKHVMKYGEKELKGRNKPVMIGIGTYIFTWALVWVLLNTLYSR